jgi:hypothetical protein
MHVANPFPVLRNQVGKILQDSGRDRRIAWDRLGITHWEAEGVPFRAVCMRTTAHEFMHCNNRYPGSQMNGSAKQG